MRIFEQKLTQYQDKKTFRDANWLETREDGDLTLDERANQLRLLGELSLELQNLLQSENFYQDFTTILGEKLGCSGTRVFSTEVDGYYQLRGQHGQFETQLKLGDIFPADHGSVGQVIHTHKLFEKAVLRPEIRSDASEPLETQEIPEIPQIAELYFPILAENKILAVLHLENPKNETRDALRLSTLESLAALLAICITNQKLYQEATNFNKKLQKAVEEKTLELRRAHERILEQQRLLQKENSALRVLVHQDQKGFEIIGKSSAIVSLLTMVDKIAPTHATVLIQGESGTGKELIARRLHFKSPRANHPYVTVNCGALQESLLESELFGHEKGSFTGAVNMKLGLCETADTGTLFLDEIGELSPGIQAKLLRFLQEGEFYRIGGKRPIRVNVRVISATNRDLEQEVKANHFREDLFYRLNTIMVKVPPLRKRKEDIPTLIDFFLKSSRFGGSYQQVRKIDPQVIDVLTNYQWPGNIRELQNTIERLKILAEDSEIKLEDIPLTMRTPKSRVELTDFSAEMPLEDVEKCHILRALAYNRGNKTKTAQILGITIKTLYNKLHRYGILQSQGISNTNN